MLGLTLHWFDSSTTVFGARNPHRHSFCPPDTAPRAGMNAAETPVHSRRFAYFASACLATSYSSNPLGRSFCSLWGPPQSKGYSWVADTTPVSGCFPAVGHEPVVVGDNSCYPRVLVPAAAMSAAGSRAYSMETRRGYFEIIGNVVQCWGKIANSARVPTPSFGMCWRLSLPRILWGFSQLTTVLIPLIPIPTCWRRGGM